MPTIAAWLKIDGERVAQALQQACEKLDNSDGELVLDFSAVPRIDPAAVEALDELVAAADEKSVKIALRGVNIDVYKVLKLVKLTPRFSFRGQ